MNKNQELRNIVGNYLKMDVGLELFAPGFVNANKSEESLIPWVGLQNLNRIIYITMTFYYFFYNEMICELTVALNEDKTEPIILEVKDDFLDIITLEKKGLLEGRLTPFSSTKMFIMKDIFKFLKSKPAKFNEFVENDPNVKLLAEIDGAISEPVILTDKDVYDYYDKWAKIVFSR